MFKHCEEQGLTYFQHMRQALYYSFLLLLSGIACLIHSLFPCFFTKYASDVVGYLDEVMNE